MHLYPSVCKKEHCDLLACSLFRIDTAMSRLSTAVQEEKSVRHFVK